MVNMRILGLSVDGTAKTPILLLQEVEGKRVLPIWIGSMEAMNISLALSGKNIPRPLTHDLTMAVVEALGGRIESIEITNFTEGTFYADIVVRHENVVQRVDCRPSDGVTLALKLGMPIYVHPDVLDSAANAKQHQDAASFQMLQDGAEKTLESVEDLTKKRPRIRHVAITPRVKAHVKTLIDTPAEREKEPDLEKLLHNLEPASSTRM